MVRSPPPSRLTRLRLLFGRWTDTDPSATEPELDPAEEFRSVQRGLRRLSLASDRSGQMLEAMAVRLDEVQQLLIERGRRPEVALALDETELLDLLDQLQSLAELPHLPDPARSRVESVAGTLLARARWRPVAHTGSRPDGADIRIAEYLGNSTGDDPADVRIDRVLEQGYRRADGTLLRPGVVVAASAQTDTP